MAANIFGLGNRVTHGDDFDDLLGMRKSQGMTDKPFAAAGRAPVDELWAGRNSAAIDDDSFGRKEATARYLTRSNRDPLMSHLDLEGSDSDINTRKIIRNKTGLDVYPGQMVGANQKAPEDMTFMQEFSDEGARLRDGWRDKENPTLGDVMDHGLLYEHYPEVANLPVNLSDLGRGHFGSYGGQSSDNPLGDMELNNLIGDEDALETLIHESQHFIQGIEGWAGGGSAGHRSSENMREQQPNSGSDLTGDDYDFQAYENIAGEILARDAEGRNTAKKLFGGLLEAGGPDAEGAQDIIDKIGTQYPARNTNEGNAHPHEMPRGLMDEIVQKGMLESAIQERRRLGVDGKFSNEKEEWKAKYDKNRGIEKMRGLPWGELGFSD
jgi:hypothetical protein